MSISLSMSLHGSFGLSLVAVSILAWREMETEDVFSDSQILDLSIVLVHYFGKNG